MKKVRTEKFCFILTLIIIFAFIIKCFSINWIDTTFKSVSEVEMIIAEKEYTFPLQKSTSIQYKTSDSSYVLISKGNLNDIKYFYENVKRYEVEERGEQFFVNKDEVKYAVKKLADDLDYVKYSVAAIY